MGNPAPAATTDYLIGKYKFTVKEDVVDGDYIFKFGTDKADSFTLDGGETQTALLSANTVKVTVGSGSTDPESPATKTNYFAAEVTTSEAPVYEDYTIVYKFTTNDPEVPVGKVGEVAIALGDIKIDGGAATIKTAVKVTDIPDGVTLTCLGAEWK